jgi:hypothetical protein
MPRAAAQNSAVRQELLDRNVAKLVQIPKQRKRKLVPWTSEVARRFLESARSSSDPLCAACVLVLVLGLRKAATMSGMGSHASDASVFVSRAGPVLRSSPGCRRGGVLAHSGWWPQAAIVGAAGSIVLLLLTFMPWWLLSLALDVDIAIVVLSWRILSR